MNITKIMKKPLYTQYVLFLTTILLVSMALISRHYIYLNLDTSALINEAQRIHFGEVLNKDFMEINPPLIVYILLVPVYIHQFFYLSLPDSFTIFMAMIILCSLLIAFQKIENSAIKLILIFIVLMPFRNIFGQREHIYIVLTLPYFISLWHKDNSSLSYQFIAGLMAGIGFCIKPYFLAGWIVFMLVKLAMDRRLRSVFNLQNLLVVFVGIFYAIFLITVQKNYIINIVPFLRKYYTVFSNPDEVREIILYELILNQASLWLLIITNRKILTRPIYFSNAGIISSLIIIYLQARPFSYYFYMAAFYGFISNTLIIFAVRKNWRYLYNKVAFMLSLIVIIIYLITWLITTAEPSYWLNRNNDNARVIELYNKYADNKPVYFLGIGFGHVYLPAVLYSKAYTRPYYGTLWALPAMNIRPAKNDYTGSIYAKHSQDEDLLISNIVSDLKKFPPEIIIIEDYNPEEGMYNYLNYFLQDQEFNKIWQNYHLIDRIGYQNVYLRAEKPAKSAQYTGAKQQ